MEVGRLQAKIGLDSAEFTASINNCIAGLTKLKSNFASQSTGFTGMGAAAKGAAGGMDVLAGSTKMLTGMIAPLMAAFSVAKLIGFGKEVAMLAAHVEHAGVMANVLGRGAGYAGTEIDNFTKSIQKFGITDDGAAKSIVKLVEANVDLKDSAKLAAVAMDAAAVAGIQGEEAMAKIASALMTGRTRELKSMGLSVDFTRAEATEKIKLGHALNEQERQQARVNDTVRAGIVVLGAHTASLGTAMGQYLLLQKNWNELKESLGKVFGPALQFTLSEINRAIEGFGSALDGNQPAIESFGTSLKVMLIDIEVQWLKLMQLVDKSGGTFTAAGALLFKTGHDIGKAAGVTPKEGGWGFANSMAQYDKYKAMNTDLKGRYDATAAEIQRLETVKAGTLLNRNFFKKPEDPTGERQNAPAMADLAGVTKALEEIKKWGIDSNAKLAEAGLSGLGKALVEVTRNYEALKAGAGDALNSPEVKSLLEATKTTVTEQTRTGYFTNQASEVTKYIDSLKLQMDGMIAGDGLTEFGKKLAALPAAFDEKFAEVTRDQASMTADERAGFLKKRLDAIAGETQNLVKDFTDKTNADSKTYLAGVEGSFAATLGDFGKTALQSSIAASLDGVDKQYEAQLKDVANMADKGAQLQADILRAKAKATGEVIQKEINLMMRSVSEESLAQKSQLQGDASYMRLIGGMSSKDNFLGGSSAMLKMNIANSPQSMAMQKQIDEAQKQLDSPANSLDKIDELTTHLYSLIEARDVLNNGSFQLIKSEEAKAQIDNIMRITQATTIAKDLTEAMVAPMADALTKFAETGQASMKELAGSLLQTVQAYAAQKTAILLLTAAFEGVMTFADSYNSAKHSTAAVAALQGASMMGAFVAGSGLAGMAHGGMTNIPEDGTWMLRKNERVVDSKTNADLKEYLKGSGKPSVTVNNTFNDSDGESVLKSLPAMRQMIIEAVSGNIASNGQILKTIQTYA